MRVEYKSEKKIHLTVRQTSNEEPEHIFGLSLIFIVCTISTTRMLTVSLLVCAMMALTQANGDVCPVGWTLHGQRCFYSEATAMTWDLAETNCVNKGGHLASIHSLEEQLYIKDIAAGIVWIGGSACKVAGAWSWTDGTPVDHRAWCPTKPNDILSDCCMQMTAAVDKCWDDLPCPASHASICSKAAM